MEQDPNKLVSEKAVILAYTVLFPRRILRPLYIFDLALIFTIIFPLNSKG